MKYFNVVVMNKGNRRTELVKAHTKMDSVKIARKNNIGGVVIKSDEVSAPVEEQISEFLKSFSKRGKKKIKLNDKIASIRQISVMTDAGISIIDTLDDITKNTRNKDLKEIYKNISSDINAGQSLSEGIVKYKEQFGHVTLAMTELGERTGNISGSYLKLSEILENMRENKAKFKKAIRYPIITLTAMVIAFTVLIMLVVPKFKVMFEKFDAELPIPTKILLNMESALSNYGLYILFGIVFSIYFIVFNYKRKPAFKYKIDKLLVNPKFYLINNIVFYSTMYNFTLVFTELVKAGIPVSESLENSIEIIQNSYLKEKLLTVNENIGRGISLSESFAETGLFEDMLIQMVRAGEAGGQLDKMMDKVTGYYDMRFQDIIDNLSTYIEPIMMFLIAGLVLLMALGIFMPMWDLGSAVNK